MSSFRSKAGRIYTAPGGLVCQHPRQRPSLARGRRGESIRCGIWVARKASQKSAGPFPESSDGRIKSRSVIADMLSAQMAESPLPRGSSCQGRPCRLKRISRCQTRRVFVYVTLIPAALVEWGLTNAREEFVESRYRRRLPTGWRKVFWLYERCWALGVPKLSVVVIYRFTIDASRKI